MIDNFILKLGKRLRIDLDYLFKNSFWTILRQLITLATGIALSVAMARFLTQDFFGQFQLFMSILGIVAISSLPGLKTSVIRSIAKGKEGDYLKAVKVSFMWSLIGIPTLLIIGGYYYVIGSTVFGISLMIASILFPMMYSLNAWDSFYQSKERFDLGMKYSAIQSIISTIALIAIVYFYSTNFILIVLLFLAFNSAFNLLWFLLSRKYISNQDQDEDTIPYGKFLTKINILNLIAAQFDKILVGLFIGPVGLAIYAIGINLIKKIIDFFKSIFAIYNPRISKMNTVSIKKYLIIFIIFVLISIGLFYLLPYLMMFLYTEKYSQSIKLAQIAVLSLPFFTVNLLYRNHFIFYLKNRNILMTESIILPIIKIGALSLLLYLFNIEGMAVYMVLQFIIGILTLFLLSKYFTQKKSHIL